MNFRIGDKIKVTYTGGTHITAEHWAQEMGLANWKSGFMPKIGTIGTIVVIWQKEQKRTPYNIYGVICEDGRNSFIINDRISGLEVINRVYFDEDLFKL